MVQLLMLLHKQFVLILNVIEQISLWLRLLVTNNPGQGIYYQQH